MKNLIATSLATLLAVVSFYQQSEENTSEFEKWSVKFNKFYHGDEKIYRESIYNQNKLMIELHNIRSDVTYTMGENQFMTITHEEFIGLYLNSEPIFNFSQFEEQTLESDQIIKRDWRNYSTVKEQGACASGWAFSVSNLLEAWNLIRQSKNTSVSTQQLVDCDTYSQGCTGGSNLNALNYVINYGLVNSTQYPYNGKDQQCKYESGQWKVQSYSFVGKNIERQLQTQPVSVGVDASNWQFYKSGVFSNCSSNLTNHYALVVDQNILGNWLVQNSFGINWGEEGHIRLYTDNTCGVYNQAYVFYQAMI